MSGFCSRGLCEPGQGRPWGPGAARVFIRNLCLGRSLGSRLRLGSQRLNPRKSPFKKLSFESVGPFLFITENANLSHSNFLRMVFQ